jgi:hypothetical protein
LFLLVIRFFSKQILLQFQAESLKNNGLKILRILKKYNVINIALYNIFQAFIIGCVVDVEIFTDDAVDPYGLSPILHFFLTPMVMFAVFFIGSICLSSFLLLCVLAVRIFLKKVASLLHLIK